MPYKLFTFTINIDVCDFTLSIMANGDLQSEVGIKTVSHKSAITVIEKYYHLSMLLS